MNKLVYIVFYCIFVVLKQMINFSKTKMKTNYKITNKISGNTQIMNQEEKDIFFSYSKTQMSNWNKYGKRNMIDDYYIEEINYLNKIPVWLITSVLIAATICSMLLHIQLNY